MAKILVVEDERDIRDLIEFTLKYAGHDVVKLTNGAEAIQAVPQVMPDLILMDVRMPRMTGYEACRVLKTMDDVKHIPVVFLSAKGQQSEMDSGMDAGAYDYILKPFAPDHLIKRVAEVLAKLGIDSPSRGLGGLG
ncbi:MAG TPA: response regulator [Aggregatilinea sp.]|jgi:CheY-like chemotaxis protein|uniref:response regulator transcription factor n=1 Tax=Aggregatilinea sp. TaxID=2806333 RepID=UPI002B9DB34B|nr:response regulator [Aggregatilinea sp.]HML23395.1 response regulator [Aggregatilinea sp.]